MFIALLAAIAPLALHAKPTTAPTTAPAKVYKPWAHQFMMIEGPALATGTFKDAVAPIVPVVHVTLAESAQREYPLRGSWRSGQIATKFAFTELLPSWNVIAPPMTGARLTVRTRSASTGEWSPWVDIGSWGRTPAEEFAKRTTAFTGGKVDVDTLVLKSPANAYELQATLYSFDSSGKVSPELHRVTAVASRRVADVREREALLGPATQPAWQPRDLTVPYRPQGDAPENLRHQVCSPTSVSMVMAYCGVEKPIVEVAQNIYDDENGLFGNWSRAVQYPASLGLDSYVTRISSMDEARALIYSGQPIVASIKFTKGEFPSNLQDDTAGHLIVIRGFNSAGDAIVNDPGNRKKGNGVIYKADELARAWLYNTGGVAYIIRKRG
ncbi:MAG: C39 family peptidase [Tepidisphaeraceae bacterium]